MTMPIAQRFKLTNPPAVPVTSPRARLVVSFDPSSTTIGYAEHAANVSPNVEPVLADAGRIMPERSRDECNVRIEQMVREALKLVRERHPDVVVVEDTSGHVGGRHVGRGAGLATYGKAVGWLICALKLAAVAEGFDVVTWLENDWTGREPKKNRLYKCSALHPGRYVPADDPGGDIGDAIMLGRAFCFRQLYEGLGNGNRK